MHHEQAGLGGLRGSRRPVLPDVLADRDRDVDAADLHDLGLVARHEVAELVEDAVVRQVVLVVPRDDAAAVDDGRGVGGRVLGGAELVRRM